jgi:hypothetical protein
MTTNRTALVAGASIDGLAAALALAQAGREPAVLDAAPAFRPLRGALTLDDAALEALDELRVAGVRRNLQAAELQILLLDALGEHRVRYGYEVCCTGQDERLARVHLTDGNYVAAPILVDALGVDSPIGLRRRAEGRIARVEAIEDAVALGRAVREEPFFLAEALDSYARTPQAIPKQAGAPRRRRIALVPAFGN